MPRAAPNVREVLTSPDASPVSARSTPATAETVPDTNTSPIPNAVITPGIITSVTYLPSGPTPEKTSTPPPPQPMPADSTRPAPTRAAIRPASAEPATTTALIGAKPNPASIGE